MQAVVAEGSICPRNHADSFTICDPSSREMKIKSIIHTTANECSTYLARTLSVNECARTSAPRTSSKSVEGLRISTCQESEICRLCIVVHIKVADENGAHSSTERIRVCTHGERTCLALRFRSNRGFQVHAVRIQLSGSRAVSIQSKKPAICVATRTCKNVRVCRSRLRNSLDTVKGALGSCCAIFSSRSGEGRTAISGSRGCCCVDQRLQFGHSARTDLLKNENINRLGPTYFVIGMSGSKHLLKSWTISPHMSTIVIHYPQLPKSRSCHGESHKSHSEHRGGS